MPVGICPNCNQRYAFNEYDVDYEHECYGNDATSQDDDVIVDQNSWNLQGLADKRGGKTIGVPGMPKVQTLTKRGNRAATHRQSQHYEMIELGEK